MEMKYGQTPNKQCENYRSRLTDRVFKILWLKEEGCSTTDTYIESLIYELCGVSELFNNNGCFISLIGVLEMIKDETIHSKYKQKIFQCTNELIPLLFKAGDE